MTVDASHKDAEYMGLALAEARRAMALGEVPVGAVIVRHGEVVATGFNRRECDRDPTGHAEIQAIRQAAKQLDAWRLLDCTLYVTLEPCPMCAGAIWSARMSRVVFGATDPKAGALQTLYRLGEDTRLNHRFSVTGGVLADECANILSDFFRERRRGAGPLPPL